MTLPSQDKIIGCVNYCFYIFCTHVIAVPTGTASVYRMNMIFADCAHRLLFMETDYFTSASFIHTDKYLFARTIIRGNKQVFVPMGNYAFVQTIRCSWEQTIVRSCGQMFVPKDNCPFPRTIVRSHGQLPVRTVFNEILQRPLLGSVLN